MPGTVMNLSTYSPSDPLKPFVNKFLIIQSEHGTENHIVPDTSVVMAFWLRGHISFRDGNEKESELPGAVVTGLRNTSRRIRYAKHSATFLVIFREGGAAAFVKEPVHELFGLHVPADNLVPRYELEKIEEKLTGAVNDAQRVEIVERFLITQMCDFQPDPIIYHAIEQIKAANGIIKIKDLMTDVPLSRDPFEKRFRRVAGTSPKQFAGILRLRHIINHHSQEMKLAETAHSAGYFDQAHFIRDFKAFTGHTPGEFFDSPSFW